MGERALEGIRVIECGEMVSAAYAAKLMADMGADVVKVEEPRGDRARLRGPYPKGDPDPEKSGLFLYLNANKRGVTLDLRSQPGREILRGLVRGGSAALLIHNYEPRLMPEMGLLFEDLHALNPALVETSISPFGQTGPHRDYRAHDLNMWTAGGVIYTSGKGNRPDLPPLKAFGQQAGFEAGVTAATASLGALFHRHLTGEGQHVDVSVQECLVAMLENNFVAWPYAQSIASRLSVRIVPQEVIRCRDGYIYMLAVEDHQWRNSVDLMGNPDWAGAEAFQDLPSRSANWDALHPLLEEWAKDKSVREIYHQAQARRVPFAPASTMGTLLASRHLNARGFFAEIAHPRAGTLKYPGAPYKFSLTPWELRRGAPCLGQHNEEVYAGELGLSASELAALRTEGII